MSWSDLARSALHPDAWTIFGRLPVALLVAALFGAGLRRGWRWRHALLTTAALGAGASVGAALLPSVIGALAGGVGAWLVAQRALGLRRPPLVALALGLTLIVAVGRIGCLVAGCCFGTPTALPWAVHHEAGTAAFALHLALGHIASDAPTSLGVHPSPLYESLALLLWIPLLGALARRLRSEGAVLALTGAFDLAVRAGIDGTRAMINVWWAKLGAVAGLDRLQGAFALGALGLLGAALVLERRARRAAHDGTATHDAASHDAASHDAATPHAVPVTPAHDATRAGWAVFGAAWLAGVLVDGAQTPFLHQLHVLTLLAAAPALPMPSSLPIGFWPRIPTSRPIPSSPDIPSSHPISASPTRPCPTRIRPFPRAAALRALSALGAPLVALALAAIPLGAVLARAFEPDGARADGPRATPRRDERRSWVYEVDHRRALLVRLGTLGDPLAALRARRRALGLATPTDPPPASGPAPDDHAASTLPPIPDAPATESLPALPDAPATDTLPRELEAPADARDAAERHDFRHWVGLALAGGATSYVVIDGCGGASTLFDRQGFGGWLRYAARRPLGGGPWTLGVGASAGALIAATTRAVVGEPLRTHLDERGGFATAWVELEEPRFAAGLALYGDLLSTATRVDGLPRVVEERLRVRVGGHLRAGFPVLGLEVGYLDAGALLGPTTFRLGLVGMLAAHGAMVRHMEDVQFRYGLGVVTYPATGRWIDDRVGFYVTGEVRPTERLSIGLQGAYFDDGGMLGVTLGLQVGD